MLKKILSFLTAAALVLNVFSFSGVYAADGSDTVKRYIILLDTPSVSEQAAENGGISLFSLDSDAGTFAEEAISAEHSEVIDRISDTEDEPFSVAYELDTVLNCIVIEGSSLDIESLSRIYGVKEVFEDVSIPLSPLDENPDADFTFNRSAVQRYTADGFRGEGTVIAVIDGAFQADHPVFRLTDSSSASLSKDDITKAGYSGDCYLNSKIPYYQKADSSSAIPVSLRRHGTHVAGITAGNNELVQGAAPEAQLLLFEAGNTGGGINLSKALSALDSAAKLGADCINMSFGIANSIAGSPALNSFRTAVKNASALGITVCHSAGNDGRNIYNGTYGNNIHFPENTDYKRSAEYTDDAELTVGSVDSIDASTYLSLNVSHSVGSFKVSAANMNAVSYSDASTRLNEMINHGSAKIIYCGSGESDADFPAAVRGNIALIRRNVSGSSPVKYSILAQNAFKNGAAAVLLSDALASSADNYKALIRACLADPLPDSNMIFGIAPVHADKLAAAAQNGTPEIISAEICPGINAGTGKEVYDGCPSYYTSWGVTNDLKLVPSLSAYGYQIFSSAPGSTYTALSGTSMASPYVSGAAAVLRQSLKERGMSGAELDRTARNLLMSTADLTRQPDGVYSSPRQIGLGNINPRNAINSQSVILGSSDLPKLDLGEVGREIRFSFTVKNISDTSAVYSLSGETMTDGYTYSSELSRYLISDDMISLGSSFDFNNGNSITVPPHGTATVSGKISLDDSQVSELEDIYTNGFFVDGIINLESQGSGSDIHCALMGYYGSWSAPPAIDPYAYTDSSYYNLTGFYTKDGKLVGINEAAKEKKADTNKLSFKDDVTFEYVPMRSIKFLTAYIDGERQGFEEEYISFPYYNSKATVKSETIDFSIAKLEEGEHKLTLDAKLPGDTNALSQLNLTFAVDKTAPTMTLGRYTDGTYQYIELEASDNFYLQYFSFGGKNVALNNEKGESVSHKLGFKTAAKSLTTALYDYAGNVTTQTISLVITDENGNVYHSLQEAVDAAPSGKNTTLNMANYVETLNKTVIIPKDKIITLNGSAVFRRSKKLTSPSVSVLGELTVGSGIEIPDIARIPKILQIAFSATNFYPAFNLSATVTDPYTAIYVASYNYTDSEKTEDKKVLVDAVKMDNPVEGWNIVPIKKGNFYKIYIWDISTMIPYRQQLRQAK